LSQSLASPVQNFSGTAGLRDDYTLLTVKRVQQRFPQLHVIARARSRTDAYEYAELGVPAVREVFGSALEAAGRVLRTLGFAEDEVERIVRRFHDYDEAQIPQGAPHLNDVKKLVALSEQGRRDIAQLLAAEARSAPQVHQHDAQRHQPGGDRELGAERLP